MVPPKYVNAQLKTFPPKKAHPSAPLPGATPAASTLAKLSNECHHPKGGYWQRGVQSSKIRQRLCNLG